MKKTLALLITLALASTAAQAADLLGLYNEAKVYDASSRQRRLRSTQGASVCRRAAPACFR